MKHLSLLLIAAFLYTAAAAQEPKLRSGQKAPNFTLEDVNGNSVELKPLLGKAPVVINFWATWCKPCIEELAAVKKLFPAYQAKGVTLLAISLDSERSVAKVKPFVKAKGYPFTILLDTNADVARLYYVQVPPYTVVLDKAGNIVYSHMGYEKGDELGLQRVLDEMLKN